MKRSILLFLIIVWSCNPKSEYDPSLHLTAQEKDQFLTKIIRYLAKRPEKVNEESKFDRKHDGYYQQKISEFKLERFYTEGHIQYFLVSQPAPSLTVKRHATGGKIKTDDQGNIIEYEEVFRTWKMVPDTLVNRSYMLFGKMVKGESLEPYLTKNSGAAEYIEFPDEKTYYDKQHRMWRTKQ